MQKSYAQRAENDALALPDVKKSIKWAKSKQNDKHLLYAYEDAMYYSPDRNDKLKYSDSIIAAAVRTPDNGLLSKAHLSKGIIYYFNFRKFDSALRQYLVAAQFSEKSEDAYLMWKIRYNIGVVKAHLGYDQEALVYFQECMAFFQTNLRSNLHPTLRFNNTRGYLNSLHQSVISERHLNQWNKVDSLLTLSDPFRKDPEYNQESAYFLKEQGIVAFHKKEYRTALDSLHAAKPLLQSKKEEGHLSVLYFYLGSTYLQTGLPKEAHQYLAKVDSLYNRNALLIPEVRQAYELLLKSTAFPHDTKSDIYYRDQLLKADRIFQTDLPYLSSRIYREYDTPHLQAEKEKLLQSNKRGHDLLSVAYGVCAALLLFLFTLWWRKRKVTASYLALQLKLKSVSSPENIAAVASEEGRKMKYSDDIVQDLLQKLKEFENKNGFTDGNLTLATLATMMHTNKNHLSYVLNEHLHTNFHTYLGTLRINYITRLMNTDSKYLRLNIDALAEICGMKSRQNFSKLFYRINKIRPSDFIGERQKELKFPK